MKTYRKLLSSVLLILFLSIFATHVFLNAEEPAKTSAEVSKETKQTKPIPKTSLRIMFVSQSAGFKHSSVTRRKYQLSQAERSMVELGITSDLFRVDLVRDVATEFTKERLDACDIVMFYTTGKLPIPQKTLDYFLNDWLKQPGHGFIGTHAATDTYKEYKPYYDMIGGTFNGHPWRSNSTVTVSVLDKNHPACKPWGDEFIIKDEIYQHKHWQPKNVHVLMSLNMKKTALKKPYHVPVAWCKEYGKGRVYYISLGHREDVWTNPKYMASMLGAIRWVAGLEPGDATPNPEVSATQDRLAKQAVAEAAKK